MATTVIDFQFLAECDDLPELLAGIQQLARVLDLTMLGQVHEREIDGLGPKDGDSALLRALIWPLTTACDRAVELERAARQPAPETPGDGDKLVVLGGGRP